MSNIYAKAYTELYEILKNIPKEDRDRIPSDIFNMLEEKRDKEYIFKLQENTEFENQQLLRETSVLLAILYRDYWATKEEKERIVQKWKLDIEKNEQEKRLKYNVSLFKDNSLDSCNVDNTNYLPIEIKRENLFKRIVSFIKKLFRIR